MNRPLPRAIQRQQEQSEAIEASLLAPPPQPEVVEAPVVVEPVAVQPPAPEPIAPVQPGRSDAYWEQRLRTLQGMHDKVVRDLTGTVDSLARKVQAIEAKPPEPTKASVDPKDVDAFGADMIEMVNRQAERVYAAMSKQLADATAALDARMQGIEERFTGVHAQTQSTREDAFYAALSSAVPNWEQINADPKWLEWLAKVDQVYGQSKQQALDAAYSALDAQRTIGIFKAFLEAQPKPRPADSLATQVAPATSGAPPTAQAAPVKRIIGQQEIQQFYHDVRRGLYTTRQAEMQRRENEINEALAEGRVK